METYQKAFVDLCVSENVLKFGEFTLKSGRVSPYFFNAGLFNSGKALSQLNKAYAAAIQEWITNIGNLAAGGGAGEDYDRNMVEVLDTSPSNKNKSIQSPTLPGNSKKLVRKIDVVFGPAYKGIPLANGVTTALYEEYGLNYGYCYNRKEAKDHGEGGLFVGMTDLTGKNVLIVDDVITAGTAIRESVAMLQKAGANIVGVVVAMDRQEKTKDSDKSAIMEVEAQYGFPVVSIIKMEHLVSYLSSSEGQAKSGGGKNALDRILKYKEEFGVVA